MSTNVLPLPTDPGRYVVTLAPRYPSGAPSDLSLEIKPRGDLYVATVHLPAGPLARPAVTPKAAASLALSEALVVLRRVIISIRPEVVKLS